MARERAERFNADADTVWSLISEFARRNGGIKELSDSLRRLQYQVGATGWTWPQLVSVWVETESPTSCVVRARVHYVYRFSLLDHRRQKALLDELFTRVRTGLSA